MIPAPTPATPLRLFFACWPTPALQRQLHDMGNRLKLQTGGRVTRRDNIHLTLAFLGDVAPERLAELRQLAAGIGAKCFALSLFKLGCWPEGGIGWLAPEQAPQALLELVQQLNQSLQQAGFRTEKRRYRPHITLLRKATRGWRSQLEQPLDWQIDEFVLVASTLDQHGSAYRIVGRWPLR